MQKINFDNLILFRNQTNNLIAIKPFHGENLINIIFSADVILSGNTTVREGSEMILKCSAVMKNPVPITSSIAWYLNGKRQQTKISKWPHLLISMQWSENNTLISVLKLSAMNQEYSGVWSCYKINTSSPYEESKYRSGSSIRVSSKIIDIFKILSI